VDSGQKADVDRKLIAFRKFSIDVAARLPVVASGARGSKLLAAPAARQAVRAVKARALAQFSDPRFVTMHQELNKALRKVGENNLAYETTSSGERAVTSTSFRAVLQTIADSVTDVANQADVRTTFLVHTDPPGATFELCPEYLTTGCLHITADATITSIFRGLYKYRVSLDGYRTIAFPLDLVHFTQTRLDCQLQTRRASPCTPR